MKRYRIGVDIGGSFTDFAVYDNQTRKIHTLKVFSRPDEPGAEIFKGLSILHERDGIVPQDVGYFTHGTTVGINTVIQRNGVKLALLTTQGFSDVLELARLKIPHIHDLLGRRPDPLITRECVFGIQERTGSDGEILEEVDRNSVLEAIEGARREGCKGIVVSLLHSYRNPSNEQTVKAIINAVAPDLLSSCSADIWPIIREYERTITAVINAYVQPIVIDYLEAFENALQKMGVTVPPRLTKSNGGVMGVAQAKKECVQMVLSGTASGVIGASYIAKQCKLDKLLSLDIGGTSADVAVIRDGVVAQGNGELIGEFPIFIPSVSVTSVGQGGGSIAWIDNQSVLQVGPRSAGSLPGPVCFQRGGTEPTVTDAFAVSGLLGHGDLGYNAVQPDIAAARKSFEPLAEKLGISVEAVCGKVIEIAISSMYSDTSGLLSRFGLDPREYYCLAFGGAGPMMACLLARELNMKGVVVPTSPGVLSALGGMVADVRNDFITTLYQEIGDDAVAEIKNAATELKTRAMDWLMTEYGEILPHTLHYQADMRYKGQSFEVDVDVDEAWLQSGDMSALHSAFDKQHEVLFGHCDPQETVQLINLKLVIISPVSKPHLPEIAQATENSEPRKIARAWLDDTWQDMAVYERKQMLGGVVIKGPAIITQADCTTCVPANMQVSVDNWGNLLITPVKEQ